MSSELIMDLSKEIPSLLSLIVSIELNDFLRRNSISSKFMKETWEVRRIFNSNHIYQAKVMANLVMNNEQRFVLFLAASKQFSVKEREIFKDQVRTLPVFFENSHVSQSMQNQYDIHIMNHFMQCFVT